MLRSAPVVIIFWDFKSIVLAVSFALSFTFTLVSKSTSNRASVPHPPTSSPWTASEVRLPFAFPTASAEILSAVKLLERLVLVFKVILDSV